MHFLFAFGDIQEQFNAHKCKREDVNQAAVRSSEKRSTTIRRPLFRE
jgi:hypothetical protein